MSAESYKVLFDKFVHFINTGSQERANELVAEEAVFFVPGRPEPLKGPAGYIAILGMMRGGFPDVQWTLEETIVEGDRLAARFTMRGTHQGPFFGVPPSNRKIDVRVMNFYRFADGKIIEEYGQPDLLGLMQQIGAIPS